MVVRLLTRIVALGSAALVEVQWKPILPIMTCMFRNVGAEAPPKSAKDEERPIQRQIRHLRCHKTVPFHHHIALTREYHQVRIKDQARLHNENEKFQRP